MTKQYMSFDNFKTLILEARDYDKTLWPGGVCWAIRFTNDDKTEGVLDYFVIVHNDENEAKIKKAPLEWLRSLKNDMPSTVSQTIKWQQPGTSLATEEEIAIDSRDAEYYSLYKYPERFSVIPGNDSDKAKARLKEYCASRIGDWNNRAKVYTLGKGDLEKFADKTFASADEETEKVKTYITQMIDKPESFQGYDNQKLSDRIKEVSKMKMGKFIKQYADYGALEAFIAKGIINLLAMPGKMKDKRAKEEEDKRRADAKAAENKAKAEEEQKKKEAEEKEKQRVRWNDKLKPSYVYEVNQKKQIELLPCIDGKYIPVNLLLDDLLINKEVEKDVDHKITNKFIFEFKANKSGQYIIDFKLFDKATNTEDHKKVVFNVVPRGAGVDVNSESIIK